VRGSRMATDRIFLKRLRELEASIRDDIVSAHRQKASADFVKEQVSEIFVKIRRHLEGTLAADPAMLRDNVVSLLRWTESVEREINEKPVLAAGQLDALSKAYDKILSSLTAPVKPKPTDKEETTDSVKEPE